MNESCAGWPEFAYDRLLLNDVKDVAFFPSRETRSYDAFIAMSDDVSATVLRLELVTGEMDVVYGTRSKRCRPTCRHDSCFIIVR